MTLTDTDIAAQFAAQIKPVVWIVRTFSMELEAPVSVEGGVITSLQVEVTTYPNSDDEATYAAKGLRTPLTKSGAPAANRPAKMVHLPDEVAEMVLKQIGAIA